MNVLSLFDGISCGQVALERSGIKVSNYFASEIKKHAIEVTMKNYPNTIQLGDVTKNGEWDLPDIDLLIGGSPCQDFSSLKKGGLGLDGEKSKLFYTYLECLERYKPKYFLLENVNMDKDSKDKISELLGVQPILINSSLVSYQKRSRLYWTNIGVIEQPKDKKLNFQDFVETNYSELVKYKVNKTPSRITMWGDGVNGKCPNVTDKEKVYCLTTKQDRWNNSGLVVFEDFCRFLTVKECEVAQNLPVGYTEGLSKNKAYDVLGDGWTVDVICHIFEGLKRQRGEYND